MFEFISIKYTPLTIEISALFISIIPILLVQLLLNCVVSYFIKVRSIAMYRKVSMGIVLLLALGVFMLVIPQFIKVWQAVSSPNRPDSISLKPLIDGWRFWIVTLLLVILLQQLFNRKLVAWFVERNNKINS